MPGYVQLVAALSAVCAVAAAAAGIRLLSRRRTTCRALPGALVMLGAAWASTAGLAMALVQDLGAKEVLFALRLPGIGLLVAATFWYAMLDDGHEARLTRRAALLLAVHPVLMALLAVTSPWHALVVAGSRVADDGSWGLDFGVAVWVHSAYASSLLLVAAGLLVRGLRGAVNRHRWQYAAVLGTMAFPIVGSVVGILLADTIGYADLTSALFVVTALSWLWVERSGTAVLQVPISTPQVLQALGDAVLVVDATGRVVMANTAAQEMIGSGALSRPGRLASDERRQGTLWGELVDLDLDLDLWRGTGQDRRVTTADGRVLDVRVTAVGPDAQHGAMVVTARDVTDVERLRAELAEQAVRDGLTGLHNRRFGDQALLASVADARTTGRPLTAAMIDLDHFKAINDAHGHAVGDQVLVRVARELASCIRAPDVLVRFGGEEFLVLMPGADAEAVRDRAETCRARFGNLGVETSSGSLRIRVSIGVAQLEPGDTEDDLLRAADEALYAAKAAGRDRVVVAPRGKEV